MVAAFAQSLQGGKYLGKFGLPQIEEGLAKIDQPSKADLLTLIAAAKGIGMPPVQISE